MPYKNKASNDSLMRFKFKFTLPLWDLKINERISKVLIPSPQKYVLTSSWFDTVKLNQGDATAIEIRKNPINNSFMYFFKAFKVVYLANNTK